MVKPDVCSCAESALLSTLLSPLPSGDPSGDPVRLPAVHGLRVGYHGDRLAGH